ncbi:MAG: hypothetical protein PHS93_10080 [Candidatus Omnitrophica bacterium]|nr:hypothetical protein [Candidatus Omnitrophota bacterium]
MTVEDISKQLETYKTAGANLLMPSTHIAGLSEFHQPIIETVKLSSDPNDGDVYAHDDAPAGPSKKWRPTKQALMKLSVCAGVLWSAEQSKRMDNGADRNYIAYKAVGGIKKADGQPVFFSAEYDLDFEVLAEELRTLYEGKAKWLKKDDGKRAATDKEKVDYVEYCVNRDLLQKRKNKLKLCEAGAMNRVLRMLLGLKQTYTTKELEQPFVMARIVFRPDFTDAAVKKQFIDASIKAMTGIYGPAALDQEVRKAEAIDITPLAKDEEPPDNGTGGTHPTAEESLLLDFQNSDELGQCKALTNMANQKGYDLSGYMKKSNRVKLTDFPKTKREDIFKHLLSLPDKNDKAPKDDVPY